MKKIIPMLILFFLISFNYHFLRIAKDALVVPIAGAEIIPFLKMWVMLPITILVVIFFTRVANRVNRENIFYIMMVFFLSFFALFIFVLYPNRESLYLNGIADSLQRVLPTGFNSIIAMIRYWMFSLFYAMAETWSNIMLALLAWGFANDVVNISESKRFYALLGIGINAAGIFAAKAFSIIENFHLPRIGNMTQWDSTLTTSIEVVIFFGLVATIIYRWLHVYVFPKHKLQKNEETKKDRMSLRNSIAYITKSKYLIGIAIMVLAYYVVLNLTEVLWKAQMKELFPTQTSYARCMAKVTFYTGIFATAASFCISGNIIRRLGWRFAAFTTPVIIAITAAFFFYFLFIREYMPNAHIVLFGASPLMLTVFFGSVQNCFTRTSKYTLFDDTKEMAFIPLAPRDRLRSKSAIDGIGSRLGKTGGSAILQVMLLFCSSTIVCAPYIFLIVGAVLYLWITTVSNISKTFEEKESTITPLTLSSPKFSPTPVEENI